MGLRIPCLRCGKWEEECACPALPREREPEPPPVVEVSVAKPEVRAEVIRMRREKRGGGREVVVFEGFPRDVDLEALAGELKKACGTGGTARQGAIELQGDVRNRVSELLLSKGFRTVRAGG